MRTQNLTQKGTLGEMPMQPRAEYKQKQKRWKKEQAEIAELKQRNVRRFTVSNDL